MEIIIGLIVVAVLVYFMLKPKKVEEAAVPYKVETPVAEPAPAPVAEAPKAKKPRVAKATTKPAVKAKTARKPKAK